LAASPQRNAGCNIGDPKAADTEHSYPSIS
ncbi:MAG: hypothetical protein ACI8Y4_005523, partial [Candidatus Poriferisodalaceae bacterium]